MSNDVVDYKDLKYGAWLYHNKRCKLCTYDNRDDIHKMGYERLSFDAIVLKLKTDYQFSVSKSTLSNHFNHHFILSVNQEQALTRAGIDYNKNSLDDLIRDVEDRKVTLLTSVSHITKSKLEQIKKIEEVVSYLTDELSLEFEEEGTGEVKTLYTSTDRNTEVLFKRWAYLQKELNTYKNELAGIFFNVQNVIAKTDQEMVKSYLETSKIFMLKSIVEHIAAALQDLVGKKVIDSEQAQEVGASVTYVLQLFESQMSVDMLFQQALHEIKQTSKGNSGT
jgi:hypothetical protein